MELHANTLEMTKAELRALLAHASTDETRPHLHAVLVEPGTCPPRVWACDSHRAAVVVAQCHDTVGSAEKTVVVVDRTPLDQALRLAGGTGRTIRLRFGPPADAPEGTVTVLGAPPGMISIDVIDGQTGAPTGASFWSTRVDAQAPPLDNVLPDPDPTPGPRAPFVHLHPAYLADVRHVVAAAESDPHPHASTAGVRFYSPTGEVDPVALTCGAWTVVIMPMGGGDKTAEVRAKAPRQAEPRDTLKRDDIALPEGAAAPAKVPEAAPAKRQRRKAA